MSTAVRSPSAPPVVASAADFSPDSSFGSVVLYGVSWETYVALRDADDNNHLRMTYDRGRLELMSPRSRRHERPHELLGRMVQEWTVARNIPILTGGETTLRREDLARGAEPDQSFHIASEAAVRAVDDLRLEDHPPPDLVIEADVTSPSIPKLPIFAAFGVPEVWRWENESLHVLRLESGEYIERSESGALPGFPFDEARRLLAGRHAADETALIRGFREYVRGTAAGEETR